MIGSIALLVSVVGPLLVMYFCVYMFMRDMERHLKAEQDLANNWRELYELEKLNFAEANKQYKKLKRVVKEAAAQCDTAAACPRCTLLLKTLPEIK